MPITLGGQLDTDAEFLRLLERNFSKLFKRGANFNGDMAVRALIVGAGAQIWQILSASATLDFPNTNAQKSSDLTITVRGARDGDPCFVSPPNGSVNIDSCFTAWVSANDTVSVRYNNYSAGALNPASGVFRVVVFRF